MFSGFFQKLGIGGKDEKDEANHYSGLENVIFLNSKIKVWKYLLLQQCPPVFVFLFAFKR
jgi:hypothetical protein